MMSRRSPLYHLTVGIALAWAVLWTSPHNWSSRGAALADPPPGNGNPTEYETLMKSIQQTVVGDQKDLGLFLRVDQKVGIGTYDGKLGAGDKWCVTVEVLHNDDLSGPNCFDSATNGCIARIIICKVAGPAGSVDIVALAMRPVEYTSTQIYPLARADQISSTTPDLGDKLRETARHRNSTPATVLSRTYDLARNPAASCASLPVDERCICVAQAKYDVCVSAAATNLADCIAYAIIANLLALAACGGATVIIPILGGVACGLIVATTFAASLFYCGKAYYTSINNCMDNFMLDMEGCGWHWVWT